MLFWGCEMAEEDNLLLFRPVVVSLDVSVEVPSLFMIVTLCFGVFTSADEAEKWIDSIHRIHMDSTRREGEELRVLSEDLDAPIAPFIRLEIFTPNILGAMPEIQQLKSFIRIDTPENDLKEMRIRALREAHRIIEHAIAVASKSPH